MAKRLDEDVKRRFPVPDGFPNRFFRPFPIEDDAGPPTAPPVNTSLPSIAGTAKVGETLTGYNGGWIDATSFLTQWQRNGANIGGTQNQANYLLNVADYNTLITFHVIATNIIGSTPATSLPTSAVLPDEPVNTVLPSIAGTAKVGETLTGTDGTFTTQGPAATITRQWLRNGSPIAGATLATYLLTTADYNTAITFRNTATNAGGSTNTNSNPTAAVLPDEPVNTVLPTITGQVKVGETLTGVDGTFTGQGAINITRRWLANGIPIGGATGQTLLLTTAQYNLPITFENTATNAGGNVVALSAPTALVLPANPVNTVLPSITGTVKVGETLTGIDGTFTGQGIITVTRRWLRNGNAIAGATLATYVLTPADYNALISFRNIASNPGGNTVAVSLQTVVVLPDEPVNAAVPTIDNTAPSVNDNLITDGGAWTGQGTLTYTYQWTADAIDIPTANAISYTVQSGDSGKVIRVRVRATNAGGFTDATSLPTAAVGGGGGFEAEYQAVLDFATLQGYTLPSTTQQVVQNQLMVDMKDFGIFQALDVFYNFFTDGDNSFARLNWVNPAVLPALDGGAVTFAPLTGLSSTGGGLIHNVFQPSISIKYLAADACCFFDVPDLVAGTFFSNNNGSSYNDITPTTLSWVINSGNRPIATPSTAGFFQLKRFGAQQDVFRNGTLLQASTVADSGLSTSAATNLAAGFQGTITCLGIGASLGTLELTLYNIWQTYKTNA